MGQNTYLSNPQGINVVFRAQGALENNQEPITVQCMLDDKISHIIQKYRNKSGDYNDQEKFIFNTKNLVPSLTVVEAGIIHNSIIYVVSAEGIKGGY